jgi:Tol biopolymer transport system component
MNADGTGPRLLANTEGRATEPRWAPDGKTIYFTDCRKVDFGVDCQVMAAAVEESNASKREGGLMGKLSRDFLRRSCSFWRSP